MADEKREEKLEPVRKEEIVQDKPATETYKDSFFRIVLDDDRLSELADDFEKDIIDGLDDREPYYADWLNYDALYDNDLPEKSEPWEDSFNINLPISIFTVNSALNRTNLAIEQTSPPIIVEPLKFSVEDEDVAKRRERYLEYQFRFKIPDYSRIKYGIYLDAFRYGTGIAKVTWTRDQHRGRFIIDYTNVEDFLSDFPDGEEKYPEIIKKIEKEGSVRLRVMRSYTSYTGIKIERVSPKNFIVGKGVIDLNNTNARFICAENLQYTVPELKLIAKAGDWTNFDPDKYKDDDELDLWMGIWNIAIEDKYDIPEYVIAIYDMNNKQILDLRAYPYEHQHIFYIPYRTFPNPDSFWGKGKIEQIFYLNTVANAIFNQILDASSLANMKMFKVRQNSLIDRIQPEFRPGARIPVQLMDDIQELLQTDVKPSSFQLLGIVQSYVEKVTYMGSYMAGQEQVQDPRASGEKIKTLLAQSQVEINDDIANLQKGNEELAFQVSELLAQFLTKEEEFKIMGNTGKQAYKEVKPIEFRKKMTYIARGSGMTANRQLELQMNMQLLNMFSTNPLLQQIIQAEPLAVRSLLDDILTLLGKKNKNELLPSEEEINKYWEDRLMNMAKKLRSQAQAGQGNIPPQAGGNAPPMPPPQGGVIG